MCSFSSSPAKSHSAKYFSFDNEFLYIRLVTIKISFLLLISLGQNIKKYVQRFRFFSERKEKQTQKIHFRWIRKSFFSTGNSQYKTVLFRESKKKKVVFFLWSIFLYEEFWIAAERYSAFQGLQNGSFSLLLYEIPWKQTEKKCSFFLESCICRCLTVLFGLISLL